MSLRTFSKVARSFANTQSAVVHQLTGHSNDNINNNDNNNNTSQPLTSNINTSSNSRRKKKKRQRMHFKPIIPKHYICPITQELMTDPVIISSGHTFERSAIVEWFNDGHAINPLTGEKLKNVDIKPNYALKDAIKEYRRKLADELFRITFNENTNKEMLYYKDNILFSNKYGSSSTVNNNNKKHIDDMNEYDGYITDDESQNSDQDINTNHDNNNKKYKKKKKNYKKITNIPIIAFMGPNNTGKSTLLNLIVGEPVFVTINELSDYDSLSKVVRFKIVKRADREFILLDVEGLFPDQNAKITDSVLKIFIAVYSISSVIVWNDIDENNPLLYNLLNKANIAMSDINNNDIYNSYNTLNDNNDILNFSSTPSGSLLPQELRLFLLKKYRKLTKKQNININNTFTHKPAFILLRRDFIKNQYISSTDIKYSKLKQKISSNIKTTSYVTTTTATSDDDPNQLISIKDENKYDNVNDIVFGDNNNNFNFKHVRSSSFLFGDYLKKHHDFDWLRNLDLFSFIDGVVLHKLNDINNDSLLSIIPKLDRWISEWCQISSNIVPIVRNNRDMLTVLRVINKYNVLSSIKYVEEYMEIKGSSLQKYFYYNANEKTLNELKLIAERFKWDKSILLEWFFKHFNRLWYFIKDFPNSHHALLYQSLFCNNYNNNNKISIIIINLSHFYYQISNKIDLYQNIINKTTNFGQCIGANIIGLSSLSLMSVIHPILGIAVVPFGIQLGSTIGLSSGAKVGDAIANSKAHYMDKTERYDLGKINDNNNNDNDNNDKYL